MYADDLQIYVQVPYDKISEGIASLSSAAQRVSTWANNNQLKLNEDKTKSIIFGPAQTIKNVKNINLHGIPLVNGEFTPFVDELVSLGIVLDNKLSWRPQIIHVTNKVNWALFGLRFIRSCTTLALRKRLVETLVMPHLDYCSVVYMDLTAELKIHLQRLANTCIRYIYGLRRNAHITPYRRELGWLKTDSRRTYFAALAMYKIIQMKEPSYLASLFETYDSKKPTRGIRKDLKVPYLSSVPGTNLFQVQSAKMWNALPTCIRDLPSLCHFKNAIWKHLFNLDG